MSCSRVRTAEEVLRRWNRRKFRHFPLTANHSPISNSPLSAVWRHARLRPSCLAPIQGGIGFAQQIGRVIAWRRSTAQEVVSNISRTFLLAVAPAANHAAE